MITIRPVEEKDLDILAEIYVNAYDAFDVGEHWNKKTAHELMQYWLHRQPDLAYCAEIDGKIAGGFFTGVKPWWDGNILFDGEIFVHPEFQRKGIGSALLKKVFQEAIKKYHVKTFDAFTVNKTEHPLSWYKKLGFRETKEWTILSGSIEEALRRLRG